VTATARFFLAIREAIDSGETVSLTWDDIEAVPARSVSGCEA
jgi:hypothetical protein